MKDFNGNQITIDFDALPDGMTDQEMRVLALIQRGRENAISMPTLAATLDISTRDLQHVIKHLIEDHAVLIASATGKGRGDDKKHGYYYPITEDELLSARTQLIHRIISTAKRLRAIDRNALEDIHGQIGLML